MLSLDNPALIYLTVFAATFLTFHVLGRAWLKARRTQKTLDRRLTSLADKARMEPARDLLLRTETEPSGHLKTAEMPSFNIVAIHKQSGLDMPLLQLAVYAFFAGAAVSIASLYFMNLSILHLFIAIITGGLFLLWYLRRARAKRCQLFCEQLPDAIDVAIRSLKAGHPFVSSLALVAEELPDPVRTEFAQLADQLSYGSRMEDALEALRSRVPADDLRYLSVALIIHEKSGGNLTNTLRTLADIIRQRQALAGKIRALSAEGRFTAKMMSVFPLVIFGILSAISPTYFDGLWNLGYKQHFFIFCIIMTVLGNYFIGRMVKLEV